MSRMTITKIYTPVGTLANTMYFAIAVAAIGIFGTRFVPEGQWRILWSIGLLVVLGFWVFSEFYLRFMLRKILQAREGELNNYADAIGAEFYPLSEEMLVNFELMSLADLDSERDKSWENYIVAKEWIYCDFSYAVYNSTRNGDYKSFTEHYGVITAKLPRELPNVFFDSLHARRRQFRFHFSRSQRHSLEGNFDNYFATYFPENYTIDSMSFISPDVMHALIDAADYDIEIIGDRLFLYGALYEPSEQLDDMTYHLNSIKKQLLDNIITYRDERLSFTEGRERVHIQAASLQRSKLVKWVSLGLLTVYLVFRVVMEILIATSD